MLDGTDEQTHAAAGSLCSRSTHPEVTNVETSHKVLVVGGMVSLTYGFLLGIPLTAIRTRQPQASRHLVTAHLAAIIQGAMLIALTVAAAFSTLSRGLETVAASLLVCGCVLFVGGAVANWLQAVENHFATRSLGWKLLATSGPLNVIGISLLLAGVLKAL